MDMSVRATRLDHVALGCALLSPSMCAPIAHGPGSGRDQILLR
jgi:hypothetical protein